MLRPHSNETALTRCGAFAPGALNDALALLLRNTLRVQPDRWGLSVTWTAEVEVPLIDGGVGKHPITSPAPVPGQPFTTRAGNELTSPDWIERLAECYFDNGADLAELAATRGLDGSGKADTHLVKKLRGWLAQHGVSSPSLRTAAIDAPPPVRQALARAIRGATALSAYEHLLHSVYTSGSAWGTCWAASSHRDSRAILEALEGIDPDHADPVLVAARAGVTWTALLENSTRRRVAREADGTVYVGPAFERNWSRGRSRPQDRRIRVARCPHTDCLARVEGGRAGVLIQLVVPELGPAGLICRACLRRPDDRHAVFPPLYRDRWSGGRRTPRTPGGPAAWIGSHVIAS